MNKILNTPITSNDLKDLNIGDIIYISGEIATGRDEIYKRLVVENKPLIYDYKNMVNFHSGPIIDEVNNKVISIGPTSSIRLESYAYDFIKRTGVKILVGKGGMGSNTSKACKEFGAIHCVYPGGCAAKAAKSVRYIKDVFLRDYGMPESIWVIEVEEFGPLLISIDTKGKNIFEDYKRTYKTNSEIIKRRLKNEIRKMGLK